MKKPELFKSIEEHSPQKLLSVTSKLENRLEDFGKSTKHVIEALDKKANTGRARYFTTLFPFIGERTAFPHLRDDLSKKGKALDYGIVIAMGTTRAASLVYSVATGNSFPIIALYGGLTGGEELSTYVGNTSSNITPIKSSKNGIPKTSRI